MCGIHAVVSASKLPEISSEFERILSCRGPDYAGCERRELSEPGISLCLRSTVLALRGDHIAKQPFVDQVTGSALCWNGEAWKIDGQVVNGNDGEAVISQLVTATQDVQPGEARCERILDLFRSVEGPFAFVYYDEPGKCLYYGRDRLGRRSLLVHVDEAIKCVTLASTAGATSPHWTEVPADGLYTMELSPRQIPAGPSPFRTSRHNWRVSEVEDLVSARADPQRLACLITVGA
jgi:asparagine synthetase B (glutamine-hydrolysing)